MKHKIKGFFFPIFRILLNVTRLYLSYFPLTFGKLLVKKFREKIILFLDDTVIKSKDGRKLHLVMPEDAYGAIVKTGFPEKSTIKMLEKIIEKNYVVFDIGANLGWYTTFFSDRVKECHSFEPSQEIFKRLVKNCNLNSVKNCILNNYAIGNYNGDTNFYEFQDLYHGLSSLSDFNREDSICKQTKIMTIDSYAKKENIYKIDLIKIDVEGSELNVLKGSKNLLSGENKPYLIIELNETTSREFGYKPYDIICYLEKYGYTFYIVENMQLTKLCDYNQNLHGINVLCVPEIKYDHLKNLGMVNYE